ncbi:hypothetical protein [Mesorhizobium sp.]|uniref:hypothetical protein n=1 Tax=Mesorhizobium sp. TaxID=1871066 RepID=UPI000FE3BB95|nr:hypothetical protein [Mesorhizobium sp.]RWK28712.1 MAG: hypothetical protein EOR40_28225 [Mesorhizobium sp.]RWK91025.1 MAG: hypothetical protein EOR52_05700 [Mesorhizobium sp.]TIP17953.1 MAG: hypothetical protein E5X66_19070 [Mesorhizobium sp.]TJV81354.1 MAG: hypothetical protein E5X45_17035 [Mesorhizobium sp.]TJW17229.1 MAG: hypothetical protein E5X42_16210 [Mesorhizobium sp.]
MMRFVDDLEIERRLALSYPVKEPLQTARVRDRESIRFIIVAPAARDCMLAIAAKPRPDPSGLARRSSNSAGSATLQRSSRPRSD